ncbi:hypothetical protein Acy02nite_47610 [Actinoplanes cyaneus]|uniref:DUF4259 domain-containing protein n=1 Tax=Actinoplanes cyaneus TaxID=52696 RepID=A0A919IRT3_9ACTN|nr:DUF4259 domain-containing protein [Actinoplanes cyaneus]MCW2138793.1 protein of unknown function (DUF4259) [Actinoplanes cyaneus]GID66880.1 hypothetical protein Acy02nite_47610 [Actinoplanes cyaneus]
MGIWDVGPFDNDDAADFADALDDASAQDRIEMIGAVLEPPMPRFPAYVRDLAINALDGLIAKPTWLAEAWNASPDGSKWRRTIVDLRAILDPPQQETLFVL